MSEVIERLVGPAAVSRYGVCPCPTATLENQVWWVERPARVPNADGSLDLSARVVCGLCNGPLGWLEEIIGPKPEPPLRGVRRRPRIWPGSLI